MIEISMNFQCRRLHFLELSTSFQPACVTVINTTAPMASRGWLTKEFSVPCACECDGGEIQQPWLRGKGQQPSQALISRQLPRYAIILGTGNHPLHFISLDFPALFLITHWSSAAYFNLFTH
jgi:hypothetical protein